MTAPLTKTRERKQDMIQEMVSILMKMAMFPKGSLDSMDMRIMKKILKNLKELEERGKPL